MTENDIARVIFANLFPLGMCPADWDSGAILGPDNCVREQFLAAVRALLSASIADTAGAKPVAGYVIPQRLNSDDPVISLYRKPEGGARFPLYTAPQAECAPREAKPIYQVLEPCEASWSDTDWLTYESTDGAFKRIVYAAPLATPSDKQEASHHWGRDGDRCIKCGDKDWMANESCSQRLIKPSDKQEPFAWMRPDVLDRLKSTIAYSAGTELLKNRKDGYVPIYATPPAPLAQSAEQDRIDAERYRFLRDKMRFSSPPGDIPTMTLSAPLEAPTHDTHKDWISDRFDASVDRTIDAAMEREND
jgi:hypothetical protein